MINAIAMSLIFNHKQVRSEFDWLASDQDRLLGYFATAGKGPIPRVIESNAKLFETLPDDLLALPIRGEAVLSKAFEWDVTEWLSIAARGIFAFDWRSDSQQYELVARPSSPIQVPNLNNDRLVHLAELAGLEAHFSRVTAFGVMAEHLKSLD